MEHDFLCLLMLHVWSDIIYQVEPKYGLTGIELKPEYASILYYQNSFWRKSTYPTDQMYLGKFSFCFSDHKTKHLKVLENLQDSTKSYSKRYISCCSGPFCTVATSCHLKREYWSSHSRSSLEMHTVFNSVGLLPHTCTTFWSSETQFAVCHIKFSNWIMISHLVLLGDKCSGPIIYKVIGYFAL